MSTVSDFSSDSFDVGQWINAALDERSAEDGLESYLASLAMKLHVVSQEYNDQLESSMLEAMSTMPGVQNEISRIEDSIAAMNVEMQDLAQQIQTFDEHNVAGVEELSRLDILKSNMEFCKNTLEEHARWNQLVREAKTFLEGGGRLADSADRISIMYRSLDVLKGMPQHEEREETYKSLRDTLLSAVHPRMVAAIAVEKIDMSTILEYNYVYDKLGCKEKLEMEYINARPEPLKVAWQKYDGSSSEGTAFLTFYEDFLSKVLALLNKERENLALLTNRSRLSSSSTPETLINISELLCTMLTSTLDSTVKRDLTRHLKESLTDGSSAKAYKMTNAFATQCLKYLLFDEHGDIEDTDKQSGKGGDTENTTAELGMDTIPSLRSLVVECNQSTESERVIGIVLKALSSIYSPLASDLSTLYASDGATLRSKLSDSISSIQLLETDNQDTGNGIMGMSQQSQSSATSNFEDATGLGLEQSDFVDSSGSALDPSQSCTLFAEKMVSAVEAIHEPIQQCLVSSGVLMGGMYTRNCVKVVSQSLATNIKALLSKLDELRIASRLNTSAIMGSSSSDYGMHTPSTRVPGAIAPTPSSVADSWARKLEMHDNSSRTLLPAALRVLQASGRLRKKMVVIDTMSMDLCAKVSTGLYSIESDEDFIQKLLLSCDDTSIMVTTDTDKSALSTTSKSVADIGLMYASYVVYRSNDKDMQKFLTSTTTSRISEPVTTMLEKLKVRSGCYFFDLCTAIPERMLATLHEESVWSDKAKKPVQAIPSAAIDGEEGSVVQASDLVIDEELLPQYALSQCGEHLLSLVQEMEVFSSSDALSDLVHLQGEAANIVTACNGWNDKMTTSLMTIIKKAGSSLLVDVSKTDGTTIAKGVEKSSSSNTTKIVTGKEVNVSSPPQEIIDDKVVQEGIAQLCLRSSCLATIHLSEKLMFGQVVSKFEFDEAENVNDSESKTGEASNASLPTNNMVVDIDSNNNEASATLFVNEWLEGVSDAVTGLLLMEITKIQSLSYHGRAQLAVDLDYMHNVVNAMGLRVHPLLTHLRSIIVQPPKTVLDAVQQIPSRTPAGIVLKVIDRCVAKAMIRGSD